MKESLLNTISFKRIPLIQSLRNTRGRGKRQIIEALSVIIIFTNMFVATLRCLLLIASTTATSLYTKQYSCRALLCLSRFAILDTTFAGRAAQRSVEATAASHIVHVPIPFAFMDILIICVQYFALYCTSHVSGAALLTTDKKRRKLQARKSLIMQWDCSATRIRVKVFFLQIFCLFDCDCEFVVSLSG